MGTDLGPVCQGPGSGSSLAGAPALPAFAVGLGVLPDISGDLLGLCQVRVLNSRLVYSNDPAADGLQARIYVQGHKADTVVHLPVQLTVNKLQLLIFNLQT